MKFTSVGELMFPNPKHGDYPAGDLFVGGGRTAITEVRKGLPTASEGGSGVNFDSFFLEATETLAIQPARDVFPLVWPEDAVELDAPVPELSMPPVPDLPGGENVPIRTDERLIGRVRSTTGVDPQVFLAEVSVVNGPNTNLPSGDVRPSDDPTYQSDGPAGSRSDDGATEPALPVQAMAAMVGAFVPENVPTTTSVAGNIQSAVRVESETTFSPTEVMNYINVVGSDPPESHPVRKDVTHAVAAIETKGREHNKPPEEASSEPSKTRSVPRILETTPTYDRGVVAPNADLEKPSLGSSPTSSEGPMSFSRSSDVASETTLSGATETATKSLAEPPPFRRSEEWRSPAGHRPSVLLGKEEGALPRQSEVRNSDPDAPINRPDNHFRQLSESGATYGKSELPYLTEPPKVPPQTIGVSLQQVKPATHPAVIGNETTSDIRQRLALEFDPGPPTQSDGAQVQKSGDGPWLKPAQAQFSNEVRTPRPDLEMDTIVSDDDRPKMDAAVLFEQPVQRLDGRPAILHTGAAPPHGHIQSVVTQIISAVEVSHSGRAELTLDPEELGKVTLNLVTSDRTITVLIAAERPETLDLLRRNIESLGQEFRELGYQDVSFAFREHRGHHDDKGGPQRPVQEAFDDPEVRSAPQPRTLQYDGHLDIRL